MDIICPRLHHPSLQRHNLHTHAGPGHCSCSAQKYWYVQCTCVRTCTCTQCTCAGVHVILMIPCTQVLRLCTCTCIISVHVCICLYNAHEHVSGSIISIIVHVYMYIHAYMSCVFIHMQCLEERNVPTTCPSRSALLWLPTTACGWALRTASSSPSPSLLPPWLPRKQGGRSSRSADRNNVHVCTCHA